MPDYSRDAAHRRYEKAAKIASDAGSNTQAGLNEAYWQLYQNADWTPEEGWAANYQEGPQAWLPEQVEQPSPSLDSSWSSYNVVEQSSDQPAQQQQMEPSSSVVVQPGTTSPLEESLKNEFGIPTEAEQQRQLNPIYRIMDEYANSIQNYQAMPSDDVVESEQEEEREEIDWNNVLSSLGGYPDNEEYSQAINAVNNPEYVSALSGPDNADTAYQGNSFGNEVRRRFFDENGNLIANPLEWNILGITSQQKTDPSTRALYEQYFDSHDQDFAPTQPVLNASPHNVNWNRTSRGTASVVGYDDIDDGTPEAREAPYVSGAEYIRQREAGIPGRPIEDIQADSIYNKQDEMEDYGYVPYIVSDEGLENFHNVASSQAVNSAFKDLSNLRRSNIDFTINYDGETYSGTDFLKNAANWSERVQSHQDSPEDWIEDPAQVQEYDIPYTYSCKMSDTETSIAPGPHVEGYDPEGNPDYPYYWEFEDGSKWRWSDIEDFRNSVGLTQAEDGAYAAIWHRVEPLVLDSGQTIRYDKAWALLQPQEGSDHPAWEDYADYGFLDLGNPAVENPIEEGGWLPWFIDMALQSSPLFWRYPAAIQAGMNAYTNNQGFEAGSSDYLNNTYSMLSANPTEDRRNAAVLGSLLLPATERLWGNLGQGLFKGPITKFVTKGGKDLRDVNPLGRWLIDASEEGLEEIPGNIVEELQQASSPYDLFANELTDEEGHVLYDSQGRAMRELNTPWYERIGNFIEQIPLSLLGGFALGGTLGGIQEGPNYLKEYNERRDERSKYGNNLKVPEVDPGVLFELTNEQRDYYNR